MCNVYASLAFQTTIQNEDRFELKKKSITFNKYRIFNWKLEVNLYIEKLNVSNFLYLQFLKIAFLRFNNNNKKRKKIAVNIGNISINLSNFIPG